MKDWSFKTKGIANDFDSHVREQLPWYELVTESVAYIARNYVPQNGRIYDIGASTGNMLVALKELIDERNITYSPVDESPAMCEIFTQNHPEYNIGCFDVTSVDLIEHFDVAIIMLTAMFLPVKKQEQFMQNLYNKMNKGGAIIIVDKVCDEDGYFSTVMKRLTMYWKLKNGAKAEDILRKELSLSGIQRPIKMDYAKQFFQLGEFKGWVIEK
jgi:tRNA (cmo5U34)-methyltransferase